MAQDYLPRRQDALLAFVLNDAALLTATPYLYGITPAEAATFNAAAQDFNAKMQVVSNAATKSKGTVRDKDESKQMLLYTIRPLLQYIKGNAGVSDLDKVALGLNPGGTQPVPVPTPTTSPMLNIVGAVPLQHTVRFADMTTPDKRAKPAGVMGLEVFCQVGDSPTVSLDNAKLLGVTTKQPFVAVFGPGNVGKTAHYWGRWINRRGETGPWSLMASLTISG